MDIAADGGIAIDFNKVKELGNRLLTELDEVRETAPIVWAPSVNGWVVTRHEDVVKAFAGELPLSVERYSSTSFGMSAVEEFFAKLPITANSVPHWIVNMDGPRHARLRRLLIRAFSRKVIEDIRPWSREAIKKTLDGLPESSDIEFVDQVARAITGHVILRFFGLPEAHLASLAQWALEMNLGFAAARPPMEMMLLGEKSLRDMREVFLPEIAARKENPRDDFLTQLVQAQDGDDRLTDDEVMGICYVSLIAGHDTTMNSMALGVDLLSRHPDQIKYMLEHPEGISSSIMEISRLSAMSTAQVRVVTADFEWHGKQIRQGDFMLLAVAAANRDPRVFDNPLKLDLSRRTDRVVTFGPGVHHCIGHLLAKMQMSEFFLAFFSRFNVEVLDKSLAFTPSLAFRGVETLHVRVASK